LATKTQSHEKYLCLHAKRDKSRPSGKFLCVFAVSARSPESDFAAGEGGFELACIRPAEGCEIFRADSRHMSDCWRIRGRKSGLASKVFSEIPAPQEHWTMNKEVRISNGISSRNYFILL